MKLARKLTFAIALAILAVMAGYAWVQVRQEVTLYDVDLQKSMRLGRALKSTVQVVWETHGAEEAQRLVEDTIAGAADVDVRWRWLDGTPAERRLEVADDTRAALRRGETVRVIHVHGEDGLHRHTYVPLAVDGQPPAVLEVSESLDGQEAFIRMNHLELALATLAVLALCTLAVMGLGYWFVGRPIAQLRDVARAVGAGDLGRHVALAQHDEIGELAAEFNAMSDKLAEARRELAEETEARIAAIEQMRHTDRLTTMGQLAAGVAHELGTPLSVITGRAEMIATGEASGEQVPASARSILEQANVMTGLIRQLLDFSRRQGPKFGLASLRAVGIRTAEMLASFAQRHKVAIALDVADDAMLVSADQGQVQQALTNVVMNGIQAMPGGGRLAIAIAPRRARPPDAGAVEGEYVAIRVEDQGQGIAAEHVARIFEPFFTTKGVGEGTGLGLSVAYGIVHDHGGWIDVWSEPGTGSRFTIYLPAAETRSATEAAS